VLVVAGESIFQTMLPSSFFLGMP